MTTPIACDHLLAMPVTNRPEAEAFIEALCKAGLAHHFDDGAVDCLHGNGLVDLDEAKAIDAQVGRCYVAWEASGADLMDDCPIGHLIKVGEEQGIFPYPTAGN